MQTGSGVNENYGKTLPMLEHVIVPLTEKGNGGGTSINKSCVVFLWHVERLKRKLVALKELKYCWQVVEMIV